jgi:hypothetical protein
MSFNPDKQYRCTIIRGKSISRMDDYLSIYAEILNEICPIPSDRFDDTFDKKLSHYIKDDAKTIKNHRTENVDKLLGMYFEKDGIIYVSDRTKKFLGDNDQPAFFKSVCFKFQQPNGSQKIQTTKEKVDKDINFKPYHFVLGLLKLAASKKIILTKNEVAYYALNALQVLQGKISTDEVLNVILSDRAQKIEKRIETKGKAYSYSFQHINEQFDYLELANLIRKDGKNIWLNTRETKTVDLFIKDLNKPLSIDFSKYDFSNARIGKQVEQEWREYFGSITEKETATFTTTISSLETSELTDVSPNVPTISAIEIGDEGENFVLQIERDRVKAFNPRLVNKVNFHGKQRGLGYDITSIEADRNKKNPEYLRYIEVKATKRVHPPDFTDTYDTINLTRNEWVAAEQQSNHFYIYRIYFTAKGTYINIIKDPVKKNEGGLLYATPTVYRVEFGEKAIDEKLNFAI